MTRLATIALLSAMLFGSVILLGCSDPSTRYYSMPPQVETAKPLLPVPKTSRIIFDEIESHAQVLHGLHPEHPNWLDGRWMQEQAVIVLHYDPARHRELVLLGLVEGYQLKQVESFHVEAIASGSRIGNGVVDQDGRFELRWPLPRDWNQVEGEVEILLEASPTWQMEGFREAFTLTLIEAAFEGAE